MSTVEQAQQINAAITNWIGKIPLQRATAVIEWCERQAIDVRLAPRQLAAAMGHQKYWSQGPDDYLDMVMAFTAAMKAA